MHKTRARTTLSADGTSYSGLFVDDIVDTAGNITQTTPGTAQGTRIQVESLDS